MERTQTNNASNAIRWLCGRDKSITVRIRHEDAKRPDMASYDQGVILRIIALPDGDSRVEMDGDREFLLSSIEAIEIKGGLDQVSSSRREISLSTRCLED